MIRQNQYAYVLVFAIFFSCWVSLSCSLSLVDMPNPMYNPELCGRKGVPRSVICDPDNTISKESKDVIEGHIIEIEEKLQLQFGVAVINTMSVLESQIDREAKRYAESLHTTWGVGDKTSQNGVLLFLSIEDRVVHISTGKGVKEKLTDVTIQSIISHMRPYLKKTQYGKAIEAAILEMDMVMENKSIGPSFMEEYGMFILIGGVFAAFGLYALYEAREERKLKEGKLALEKLMHEVKAAEDNKFQFDSCPICLENFSQHRDPADMEHLSSSEDTTTSQDTDPLMNSHSHSHSHGTSAYTASSQFREVRNMLPGQASVPVSPSSSSSISSDELRPMTLHCGHAFCHGCLKEYLSSVDRNTVCPICRAPVDPDTPPPPPSAPPAPPGMFPSDQSQQQQQQQQQPPRPSSGDSRGGGGQDYSNPSCHSSTQHQQQHQQQQQQDYQQQDQQQGWGWGQSRSNHRMGRGWGRGGLSHFHEMEILYRLSRMQRRYPTVVTPQSYDTMRTAIETGNTPAFTQAAEARTTEVGNTLADLSRRREAAKKGSKGSSRSSFGGGSSRGGGGGGGRW